MGIGVEAHIYLILRCETCDHEWDIEDYDAEVIETAIDEARAAGCPNCAEMFDGEEEDEES